MTDVARIGLVVHPSRDISEPLGALTAWAKDAGAEVVQVPIEGRERELAPPGDVEGCDVVVAMGGDGTTLAAMRAAVAAGRPVLGVACGSLGVLTAVPAEGVAQALARVSAGDWRELALPALRLTSETKAETFALNDIAIVRSGAGQVKAGVHVDGVLFARFAGDGCIVSTAVGASAYALAARGPLLMPTSQAYLVTPLTIHGGFCPPLVLGPNSQVKLEIEPSYGGARLEVDGQVEDELPGEEPSSFTLRLEPGVSKSVTFADQEPFLTGLRRRRLITDSPRIIADEERAQPEQPGRS